MRVAAALRDDALDPALAHDAPGSIIDRGDGPNLRFVDVIVPGTVERDAINDARLEGQHGIRTCAAA